MRKLPLLALSTALLTFYFAAAQDSAVSVRGTVTLSIKQGTIDCDLFVSDIPRIQDYVIRINHGMNIHAFREEKYHRTLPFEVYRKDTVKGDETLSYYLRENLGNPARYLPEEFEVRYGGRYAVADSTTGYTWEDWRGNLAFNGYSFRADGLQSGWYPTFYDLKRQVQYEQVRYDITISCADCSVLFVNGCAPVRSKRAHFTSTVPRELAIYCGNFETTEINNSWVLNADMSKALQKDFLAIVNRFKEYYGGRIGIPYKGNVTYVNTDPTADPRAYAFSYIASPSFFNVGYGKYGIGAAFDPKSADRARETVAHELGHYYFGTLLRLNTAFGHVIEEGCAEYLSFKATQHLISDTAWRQLLRLRMSMLQGFHALPFSAIQSAADYHDRETYLYNYTPVILTAVEKAIGEEAMWRWLRTMVETKTDFTDYAFFERMFDAAVSDTAKAALVKSRYFTSDQALANALRDLSR